MCKYYAHNIICPFENVKTGVQCVMQHNENVKKAHEIIVEHLHRGKQVEEEKVIETLIRNINKESEEEQEILELLIEMLKSYPKKPD